MNVPPFASVAYLRNLHEAGPRNQPKMKIQDLSDWSVYSHDGSRCLLVHFPIEREEFARFNKRIRLDAAKNLPDALSRISNHSSIGREVAECLKLSDPAGLVVFNDELFYFFDRGIRNSLCLFPAYRPSRDEIVLALPDWAKNNRLLIEYFQQFAGFLDGLPREGGYVPSKSHLHDPGLISLVDMLGMDKILRTALTLYQDGTGNFLIECPEDGIKWVTLEQGLVLNAFEDTTEFLDEFMRWICFDQTRWVVDGSKIPLSPDSFRAQRHHQQNKQKFPRLLE